VTFGSDGAGDAKPASAATRKPRRTES
jgi:hypothetical protein